MDKDLLVAYVLEHADPQDLGTIAGKIMASAIKGAFQPLVEAIEDAQRQPNPMNDPKMGPPNPPNPPGNQPFG